MKSSFLSDKTLILILVTARQTKALEILDQVRDQTTSSCYFIEEGFTINWVLLAEFVSIRFVQTPVLGMVIT